MQELNLDVAGEFMVMAATLIHIKSKMLVPIEPTEAEGDEEFVDPREELVRRLLEFQRYKEAAGVLHQQAQIRAAQWTRPDTVLPRFDDAGEEMLEAGLYDLIAAFKELLDRRKALVAHEVEDEGPPVEQRMEELLAMIREGESLEFLELFAALETKAEMIMTFLALLELIRLKRVRVYQRGMFGPIRVFRPGGPGRRDGAPVPRVAGGKRWTRDDEGREGAAAPEAPRAGAGLRARRPGSRGRPLTEPDDVGRGLRGRRTRREASRRPAEPRRRSVLPPPQVRAVLEALVFASPQPITPREIARVLQGVPREDWQSASSRSCGRLRARRARAADRRGRRRLPDHDPARVQRLGPRAARPAHADAPLDPGPRDARRHRLQAAGDAARDHRAARREVGRRREDAAREAPHPHHGAQGGRGPADPLRHHQAVPPALRPQETSTSCRRSRSSPRCSARRSTSPASSGRSSRRCRCRSASSDPDGEQIPLFGEPPAHRATAAAATRGGGGRRRRPPTTTRPGDRRDGDPSGSRATDGSPTNSVRTRRRARGRSAERGCTRPGRDGREILRRNPR